MKKAILIAVITVPMLTGCGFLQKFLGKDEKVEPPAVNSKVVVDPKLLQSCAKLDQLPPDPTFDDIAHHYISTIGLYGECSSKQEDSIKTIRKLANIEAK